MLVLIHLAVDLAEIFFFLFVPMMNYFDARMRVNTQKKFKHMRTDRHTDRHTDRQTYGL